MEKLNLCYLSDSVDIGEADAELNARLRYRRPCYRHFRLCLCHGRKCEIDVLCLAVILIFYDYRILVITQKLVYRICRRFDILYLCLALIKLYRHYLSVRVILVPDETEGYALLSHIYILKHHRFKRGECLACEYVGIESASVKRVVACRYNIGILCCGLESVKFYRGRVRNRKALIRYDILAIVKNDINSALAQLKELQGICYRYAE